MDNNTNLELEILITLSQNRKIASSEFSQLFEDQWNRYDAKFRELSPCGLFEEVISSGVKVYSLTDKGKIRITDLIDQRNPNCCAWHRKKRKRRLHSGGGNSYWTCAIPSISSGCACKKRLPAVR